MSPLALFETACTAWVTLFAVAAIVVIAARVTARIRHGKREASPRHPARRWKVTDEEIREFYASEKGQQ